MRKYSKDGVFLKLSFYWQAKKKKKLDRCSEGEKNITMESHLFFKNFNKFWNSYLVIIQKQHSSLHMLKRLYL